MAKTKEIKAGDFSTRVELENHVRNHFGLTADPKPTVQIVGTTEELRRLQLSSSSVFWGIGCVCPEGEAKREVPEVAVPRGKRTDFGIQNRETKKKAPKK